MHRKLLPCAAEVGKRAIQRGNFEFELHFPALLVFMTWWANCDWEHHG